MEHKRAESLAECKRLSRRFSDWIKALIIWLVRNWTCVSILFEKLTIQRFFSLYLLFIPFAWTSIFRPPQNEHLEEKWTFVKEISFWISKWVPHFFVVMEIENETVFKASTEPILSSKTVHFQCNYTKTAFRMISVSNLLCDYLNFSGFLFLLQCADRSGWRAMNVMRKTEPEVWSCWINWIEKVANKIKWIRSNDEENEEKRQWSCGLLMSLCDCLTRSCNSSSVQPISSLRSRRKNHSQTTTET